MTIKQPQQSEQPVDLVIELARATPDLVVVDEHAVKLRELRKTLQILQGRVATQAKIELPKKITDNATLATVEADLRNVKVLVADVQRFLKPFKDWAFRFHRAFTGYESQLLVDLLEFESEAKQLRQVYLTEQERIRQEIQDRENARLAAEAEKERKRLLAEAEKLKTPELKQQRIAQAEAVEVKTVTVASSVPKADGFSERKSWKAVEITDPKALMLYLLQYPDWQGYIDFKQRALDQLAARIKDTAKVPGVIFKEVTSTGVSTK